MLCGPRPPAFDAAAAVTDPDHLLNLDYRGFMRFVKMQPCCVTGSFAEVEAAHLRGLPDRAGTDLQPRRVNESRYLAVPLTRAEHLRLHEVGEEAYFESVGRSRGWAVGVAMKLLVRWHGRMVVALASEAEARDG